MPYVRAPHRVNPVIPVRPGLPPHRPVNQRPPVAPRFFPILQAPTFSLQSDLINDNKEQQQQTEMHTHSTTVKNNHKRKTTQHILFRVPTNVSQSSYPTKSLLHLSTRSIRRADPKYSSQLYSTR